MQHLTDTPRTTEHAPSTAEEARVSAEVGRRLADAQSADQAWRTELVLGLYRRLQWLRRFDRAIQYTAATAGVGLLVAALALAITYPAKAGTDAAARLALALTVGGFASACGGLILVAVVAACQAWIRKWIARTGMEAHLQQFEQADTPAVAPQDWTCTGCGTENLHQASTCALCGEEKPAVVARAKPAWAEIHVNTEPIFVTVVGLLGGLVALKWLYAFLAPFFPK